MIISLELWIKRIILHRVLSKSSNLIENVDVHVKNVSEVEDSIWNMEDFFFAYYFIKGLLRDVCLMNTSIECYKQLH